MDDRTPRLSLPLPSPDNLLCEDVARLRDALTALDVAVMARATSVDLTARIAGIQQQLDAVQQTIANTVTRSLESKADISALADEIAARKQADAALIKTTADLMGKMYFNFGA